MNSTGVLISGGYAVGELIVESDGVGKAKAVFHCDDGTKIVVCSFRKEADRWIDPEFPSRKLKQSWRRDHAVNRFYATDSYVEKAVLHSNYDRHTKGDILVLLAELKQAS
jgi:hypothetical protein